MLQSYLSEIDFFAQTFPDGRSNFSAIPKRQADDSQALLKEGSYKPFVNTEKRDIKTIYIGGGTPSLARHSTIKSIVQHVKREYGQEGTGVHFSGDDCSLNNLERVDSLTPSR